MIKFIIAHGIGFAPGDTHWIPTMGFTAATVVPSLGGTQNQTLHIGPGVGI